MFTTGELAIPMEKMTEEKRQEYLDQAGKIPQQLASLLFLILLNSPLLCPVQSCYNFFFLTRYK
jgi:hypothetical protein